MEQLFGQSDAVRNPSAIAERVLADARRVYAAVADDAFIERSARQAVDELMTDAIRVRNFVPVLAMRRVRDLVEAGPATV